MLKQRYQSQVVILLWRLSILKEEHREYLTTGINQQIALYEMNKATDELLAYLRGKYEDKPTQ